MTAFSKLGMANLALHHYCTDYVVTLPMYQQTYNQQDVTLGSGRNIAHFFTSNTISEILSSLS